jgi:predicted phosphodiesterase
VRIAVIADVHANRPALERVLDAVQSERVDRVLCLGDLVGYYAEPDWCVRQVRDLAHLTVAGNHDVAVATGDATAGTNEHARLVIRWTRTALAPELRQYLASLPACARDPAGVALAHGCYLNDTFHRGYVTSTMVEANLRVLADDPAFPSLALCGHTHVPMCAWLCRGRVHEHDLRQPVQWPKDAAVVLCNPGSVGQPRDGDSRAAFAVLDLEARRAHVRRVAYDTGRVLAALRHAGLPEAIGHRLRRGR